MPEMTIPDMREGYVDVVNWLVHGGTKVSPRGIDTREVTNVMLHVEDPRDCLPIGINRRSYSTRFAALEAVQLISGLSDVELTLRVNPNMEQFLDTADGVTQFHGAYGPRIRHSLRDAVRRLKEDRDTRQAVVTILDSDNDISRQWKDVPCTIALHFSIRRDRLLLTTHMRSNDVWWGLGYDVFQFTQLQLTVANVLGIEAGTYTHVADSLHAYERDMESMMLLKKSADKVRPYYPRGFSGDTIGEAQRAAAHVVRNTVRNPSATESWYLDKLHDQGVLSVPWSPADF